MSDSVLISDELTITVYHPLYMFFPHQMAAIGYLKNSKHFASNAIDLMYIPAFTTFIESVLSEMFSEFLLKKEMGDKNELSGRLFNLNKELLKGTWGIYKRNFELAFGSPLDTFVPQETLESMQSLYDFRNQSIHGKQISHEIANYGEGKEMTSLAGHYKNLNAYFLERDLLTRNELDSITFINDKIIAHFLGNIKILAAALADKVMKVEQLEMYNGFKTQILDKLT